MQAVETAVWLHTEPGDGVVLFTPVYFPFFPAVTSTGRRIVDCPLDPDGWRIDPERLASAIDSTTRAILLCNPHNPTGRVFDAEELGAIAEVAERHDLLVISDEIWGDLTHPGAKHIPIASLGEDIAERTVTISAASKAFNIAGLHCAVAHIGHAGVADGLGRAAEAPARRGRLARGRGDVRGMDGGGAVAGHGPDAPHRAARPPRRSALRRAACRRLRCTGGDVPGVAGLPSARARGWPEKVILERGRVALSAGLDFGAEGAGFARLNFATSREILDEIVDRIVLAVRDTE